MMAKVVGPVLGTMAVIVLLFASHAQAQQEKGWLQSRNWKARSAKSRVYDPETVQIISGTVAGVEKIRPMESMPYGVHLLLQTGTEMLSVHLGPFWFLEEQGMILARGDRVQITGSRISLEGREAMIAAILTRAGKTLQLRDEDGVPLWSGWRRHSR